LAGVIGRAGRNAGRGLALLADVADRECRDGPPQLVIGRKHPWLVSRRQAMPVLPRPLQEKATTNPVRHVMQTGWAKREAEEPALEIAAEFVLDVSRHGSLGSFPPLTQLRPSPGPG